MLILSAELLITCLGRKHTKILTGHKCSQREALEAVEWPAYQPGLCVLKPQQTGLVGAIGLGP